MTDRQLSDILDDAGSRISVSPAPLPVILAEAAHRRRLRAASWFGAMTVAVVLIIVAGAVWLPGSTGGSAPPPGDGRPPVAGGDSRTKEVEVSRAEVERRCTIVWRNLYGADLLPVELRKDDTGPWFEGDAVEIANWWDVAVWDKLEYGGQGEPLNGIDCVVPQAGLEDTTGTIDVPLPTADDQAGIRAACGRWLGWDFSDWQVIAADSSDTRLAAVLGSADGYVTNCRLDEGYVAPSGHLDLADHGTDPDRAYTPYVEITPASKHPNDGLPTRDYEIIPYFCRRDPPGRWVADCLGTGYVFGPEPAARIVITDVTGTAHEIPVIDRWFAFAGTVTNEAGTDHSHGGLHLTVYAADGTTLADYDESDMPLST